MMNLDYKVIYSDRRTLRITVERDRSVTVRVPNGTEDSQIHKAIESKKEWIWLKLQSQQKYTAEKNSMEFVSGERILYLGRNYRLEIVRSSKREISLQGKFFIAADSRGEATQMFRTWFAEKARKRIPPRASIFAKQMGTDYKSVVISNLKYRWGSCTPKGNLNFNWRLIKAPMFVIDYVIVHEIAHLMEPNHSERFWRIVESQAPAYLKAKQWLRANGSLLEQDFS